MKIGFIGTGTMGAPMCTNLIQKSGCETYVFDVYQPALAPLVELGAHACDNVADVCKDSDIVFSMLPRDEHVQDVYEQIIPIVKEGQIFVDMSTISPSVSRKTAKKVQERGGHFLDAPVVKSKPAAITGTLGIYVGGPKELYEKVLPLLSYMGSTVLHLGDNGAGLVMKLCHNMLVSQIQNGVNEMLTLAKKTGNIDVEQFAEAVACGGARNFYLDSKLEALKNNDFTPAFAAAYMHKDVFLAKKLCEEVGLTLEGVNLAASRYEKALELGLGKEDFCSTIKIFRNEEA